MLTHDTVTLLAQIINDTNDVIKSATPETTELQSQFIIKKTGFYLSPRKKSDKDRQ